MLRTDSPAEEPCSRPSVNLAFNVKYGAYTANALYRAGLLRNFYSVPLPMEQSRLSSLGGSISKRWLAKRGIQLESGLPLRNVYAGDILEQLGRKISGLSTPKRVKASQFAFDTEMNSKLRVDADVLHFASGIGLQAARRYRKHDKYIVCHRRALHHAREAELVARSSPPGYTHPESAISSRLTEEYRLADLIICNSKLAYETFIQSGFDPGQLTIIHEGVDTDFYSPREGPGLQEGTHHPDGPLKALFVGSIDRRKGIDVLAKAVAGTPLQIRLAGRVGDSEVMADLQRSASVEYLGELGPTALREEYRATDILVLPSRADAFGYVVSEALACGTPVVVTENCGSAEMVRGDAGRVVAAADVDSLRHALKHYSDPAHLETAKIAALALRPNLSWDRYGDELLEIYRSTVRWRSQ